MFALAGTHYNNGSYSAAGQLLSTSPSLPLMSTASDNPILTSTTRTLSSHAIHCDVALCKLRALSAKFESTNAPAASASIQSAAEVALRCYGEYRDELRSVVQTIHFSSNSNININSNNESATTSIFGGFITPEAYTSHHSRCATCATCPSLAIAALAAGISECWVSLGFSSSPSSSSSSSSSSPPTSQLNDAMGEYLNIAHGCYDIFFTCGCSCSTQTRTETTNFLPNALTSQTPNEKIHLLKSWFSPANFPNSDGPTLGLETLARFASAWTISGCCYVASSKIEASDGATIVPVVENAVDNASMLRQIVLGGAEAAVEAAPTAHPLLASLFSSSPSHISSLSPVRAGVLTLLQNPSSTSSSTSAALQHFRAGLDKNPNNFAALYNISRVVCRLAEEEEGWAGGRELGQVAVELVLSLLDDEKGGATATATATASTDDPFVTLQITPPSPSPSPSHSNDGFAVAISSNTIYSSTTSNSNITSRSHLLSLLSVSSPPPSVLSGDYPVAVAACEELGKLPCAATARQIMVRVSEVYSLLQMGRATVGLRRGEELRRKEGDETSCGAASSLAHSVYRADSLLCAELVTPASVTEMKALLLSSSATPPLATVLTNNLGVVSVMESDLAEGIKKFREAAAAAAAAAATASTKYKAVAVFNLALALLLTEHHQHNNNKQNTTKSSSTTSATLALQAARQNASSKLVSPTQLQAVGVWLELRGWDKLSLEEARNVLNRATDCVVIGSSAANISRVRLGGGQHVYVKGGGGEFGDSNSGTMDLVELNPQQRSLMDVVILTLAVKNLALLEKKNELKRKREGGGGLGFWGVEVPKLLPKK